MWSSSDLVHAHEFGLRERQLELGVPGRGQEAGGAMAVLDGAELAVAPVAGAQGQQAHPGGGQLGVDVAVAVGENCAQEVDPLVFQSGGQRRWRGGSRVPGSGTAATGSRTNGRE